MARKPPLPRAGDNKRQIRTLAQMREDTRREREAKEAALAEAAVIAKAAEKATKVAERKETKARTVASEARAKVANLEKIRRRAENAEAQLSETQEELEAARQRLAQLEPHGQEVRDEQFKALSMGGEDMKRPQMGQQESENRRSARANLYNAFDMIGGAEALASWGRKNPDKFYPLWARLVPVEVEDESKKLPLETLLGMLAAKSEADIRSAAKAVGEEILAKQAEDNTVDMDAAIAAYSGETLQ